MPPRSRAADTTADRVTAAAEAEPTEVTLVSPDGSHEETVSDPTYVTSLIYGMGYRVKDEAMSTTEAVATVQDPVAATGAATGEAQK
jgi:hypothetical protein